LEFWALTPRETYAVIKSAEWRFEQEHRNRVWLAWHTAAFSRAKRLPALRRLLGTDKAKKLEGAELEKRRREHADMSAALKKRMNLGR
jgi:hypothetical protein